MSFNKFGVINFCNVTDKLQLHFKLYRDDL